MPETTRLQRPTPARLREKAERLAEELGPEVEDDLDRQGVKDYWARMDRAGSVLGQLAGWDEGLLRDAVGPPLDIGEATWRLLLVMAAIRAEQMAEPPEEAAVLLAGSALLGAEMCGDGSWVDTLAGTHNRQPREALTMAREMVPLIARRLNARPDVDKAQEMLGEACRLVEARQAVRS